MMTDSMKCEDLASPRKLPEEPVKMSWTSCVAYGEAKDVMARHTEADMLYTTIF